MAKRMVNVSASDVVTMALCFLAVCCAAQAAPAPLVQYKFDETVWPPPSIVNSGTAANADAQLLGWANMYQVSTTPNNFSLNGVTFYVPPNWGGVEMITDSTELDNLSAMTVTFWINMRNNPGNYQLLADSGGRFGTGGFYIQIGASGETPTANAFNLNYYVIGAGNWVPSAAGESPVTYNADGKWTFVALTYGSNTMRFFTGSDVSAVPLTQVGGDVINVDYQGNPANTGVDANSKLTIGNASSGQAGSNYCPPVWMDDFRIYGSVLSADDLDRVRLENITNATTLHGTVILGDYTGDGDPTPMPIAVRVELRQGGNLVQAVAKTLDGSGSFSVSNVTSGTYDVAIKSYAHLQKVIPNVTVDLSHNNLGPITLINGDSNGDNEVTSSDLSIVLTNMDAVGN